MNDRPAGDDSSTPPHAGPASPDPRVAEFERRVLACPTLPALPAVGVEVLRLCRDADADLRRVADAIAADPALAARVLRAANSAAVGARNPVTTLPRAVALLGATTVTSLTLSFSLLRNRRQDAAGGLDRGAFWRRAVFSAIAGRALAQVTAPSSVDPDEAFTAALLQDLGMLALAEVFRDRYGQLCAHAAGDHDALAMMERDVWGTDHAAASALLARAWRLPRALERAIAASHDGAPDDASGAGRLAECVALSGRIADAWLAPSGGDTAAALDAARARLGLSRAVLEAVVARMALEVPCTAAELDVDLGGQARADEMVAEARRLLRDAGLPPPVDERAAAVPADDAGGTPMEIAFAYARAEREPLALLVASDGAPSPAPGPCALRELFRACLRPIDLLDCDDHHGVVALLPASDLAAARTVAEQVLARARCAGHAAIQIGVAASPPAAPAASLEALLAAATAALASCARTNAGIGVAPPTGAA